ncbi:(2Fe-2S) ferredoxin domain-containing protein [Herpetosiphon giganteus]|uniref:(2Fe-2S) ferredoxin domain-containing protein n=1 Tax=Herpetosiphon giganteus TaxID=2029754 RepID=UPI001959432D|nr:(2Fe-2S) ferredoxin domain-containing protein [Herpetosiphon giganteus]MBM7845811.1 NADP-reducing hydrogenase subunit HndC [Herpetosiphon giganteus]
MNQQSTYRIYLCHGLHCGSQLAEVQRSFEHALAAADLYATVEIRLSNCLGRCERGPNAIIQPGRVVYCQLNGTAINRIVHEHLLTNTPIVELRDE